MSPRLVRLTVLLMALSWLGLAQAETAKIAAGEYAPFVTQQLPDDGVTAAIVSAAFYAQGVSVSYDFLPWKRGYYESELGKYVGTFPYLKTAEREAEFLYSEPIYTDNFRLFVRKAEAKERNWRNKSICIPLGYDTTQLQSFFQENQIVLERPSELANCFNMLEAGRVEAVWASSMVGNEMSNTLFGRNSKIGQLDMNFAVNSKYYFIVSKKLPDAQKWLSRFNAGLKIIQANGSYKQIISRFAGNPGN